MAKEVLAKHDENYMPPEVAAALEEAHGPGVLQGKGTGTGTSPYSGNQGGYE